jgi:hypothetical protein
MHSHNYRVSVPLDQVLNSKTKISNSTSDLFACIHVKGDVLSGSCAAWEFPK